MSVEVLPLTGMVTAIALEVSQSQQALDLAGIRFTEQMTRPSLQFDGERLSMLELGFAPSFYQLTDTRVEIRLSLTTTRASADVAPTTQAASVDARYAARFQYSTQSASILSTRMLPIPAPTPLMDAAHKLAAEGAAP